MINKYPYTDFHEMNLDWFLNEFKELYDSWVAFKAEVDQEIDDFETAIRNDFSDLEDDFDDFKEYVQNYLDTFDFDEAVADVIMEMVNNGSFLNLMRPSIHADVTEWLNDNVTPVGSAVVVDSSLLISGAAADAQITGDKTTAAQNELNNINALIYTEVSDISQFSWESGGLSYASGAPFVASNYVRNANFMIVKAGSSVRINTGYKATVCLYSTNSVTGFIESRYLRSENDIYYAKQDGYLRVAISDNNDTAQTDTSITSNITINLVREPDIINTHEAEITDIYNMINNVNSEVFNVRTDPTSFTWESGGIATATGANYTSSNYIRTKYYISCKAGTTITCANGYKIGVFAYEREDYTSLVKAKSPTTDGIFVMPIDGYIRFCISDINNTAQTDVSIAEYAIISIIKSVKQIVPLPDSILQPSASILSLINGVYDLYDQFVSDGLAVRSQIATVQNLPIYRYDFNVVDGWAEGIDNDEYTGNTRLFDKYKILMLSGVHGNEKGAVIWLYEYMRNICYNPNFPNYLALADYTIIPIVNPTGYNANTRDNYEDINLNRLNLSSNCVETIAIKDVIDERKWDLFIDNHNTATGSSNNSPNVNAAMSFANVTPTDDLTTYYRVFLDAGSKCTQKLNNYFSLGFNNGKQTFFPWQGTASETFRQYGYTHTKNGNTVGSAISATLETSRRWYQYSNSDSYWNASAMICGTNAVFDVLTSFADFIAQ